MNTVGDARRVRGVGRRYGSCVRRAIALLHRRRRIESGKRNGGGEATIRLPIPYSLFFIPGSAKAPGKKRAASPPL
ncbi:hypothetical protein [Xanthomonas sp. 1678]|uniref:hypothetical protein n=1 Tax=Xanthomonas sp. 1678 TaxID=3158788 RepID=UPI00285FE1C2|nr:hypothetical protein [Xanthomonas translucens]